MSRAAAVELTALEHLRELWLRLMGSVIVMFVGGGIAYVFRLQIINFLQRPLHEQLYYTSPTGSFQFVMQVCLLCGVILALPILIYNILRYIEPAFSKAFSRKFVLLVLGSSLVLTAAGVLFGYYLTLPFALRFFTSVGTSSLHALISVNQYFSFILGYLATFAVVFQLPLLLLFVNHITPFPPGGLTKWRKHLYIGAFGISLIMPSSPDPLSQVSLAIPIISLYEISVLLIWAVNRKKRRHATRLEQVKQEQARHSKKLEEVVESRQTGSAAVADIGGFEEIEESFSIARLQDRLRAREQARQSIASTPVKSPSISRTRTAVQPPARRSPQQPIRRVAAPRPAAQFSSREPRLINDVI